MSMIDIYVRDKNSGKMHRVGDDIHDMLTINDDGQLCYHNLQNGDGCHTDNNIGGYEFVPNQDEYGYNCVPTSRKELSKIPSAQPETHDKRMETHACDLIDRQAAIDALTRKMVSIPTAGEKDLMGDVNRIRAEDISVIKRLPSAQPVAKDINVPVKDCIGRQAAVECDGFREVERDDERRSN